MLYRDVDFRILCIGVSFRGEHIEIMEPLKTLYEDQAVLAETLPAPLAVAYDGGLVVSEGTGERPYVIANFVETLDGIVSYNAPGQTGGGVISGEKEQDKMVMGLLRARADAIIFGTSSLHYDANHLRTPAFIYRNFAHEYEQYRQQLGKQDRNPLSVIVSSSGDLNLDDRTFHTPGVKVVIATTEAGHKKLSTERLSPQTALHVVDTMAGLGYEQGVSPAAVLQLLAHEYGVRVALYEGGPTLLGSFLAQHLIDELFLTLAPQLAGQTRTTSRLALVEGYAFSPQQAPWGTLVSVKQAGSHLLLRYRL